MLRIANSATRLAAAGMIAAGAILAMPTAIAQNHPALQNVAPESAAVNFAATIRSLDPTTREVVLQGRSGAEIAVTAGPAVRCDKRFSPP